MMRSESSSVNRGQIAAHSYLDPVDLVECAPEPTISDEALFWVLELGLEFVTISIGHRCHLQTLRPLLHGEGIVSGSCVGVW